MADPRDKLVSALNYDVPKPAATVIAKPMPAPKPPKGPDYEPLPIQPDEHSDYMGKQLNQISKRINTKGQEMMKTRLLKTSSSKGSSKR